MPDSPPYRYTAFGLVIESDYPILELLPYSGESSPDLTIKNRDLGIALPTQSDGIVFDYTDPAGTVMAWPGVAAFRIVDERTIWARKYEEAPDAYFAFPLLGPVMAWYLHLRRLFVLHASAVHIENRTLAFLGDKLAGKSTTAAAFVRAGASLVTDDLLAIEVAKGKAPISLPAFPQLKLEDSTSETIIVEGASARPLVMEGFPKRQHALPSMITEAVPIHCLVRLQRGGDRPELKSMDQAEAASTLNRFSYMVRFSRAPWTKEDHARHFAHCVQLAEHATIGTLHVPHDLTALDDTVELMKDALAKMPP